MPTLETVEALVHLVESGQTLDAMRCFYAENATMQENLTPPRDGKSVLIQHEVDALASISRLTARCLRPILISADIVVIRWVFEIQEKTGKTVRLEELAYQRWEGNLIFSEQFFYDPGQLNAS